MLVFRVPDLFAVRVRVSVRVRVQVRVGVRAWIRVRIRVRVGVGVRVGVRVGARVGVVVGTMGMDLVTSRNVSQAASAVTLGPAMAPNLDRGRGEGEK